MNEELISIVVNNPPETELLQRELLASPINITLYHIFCYIRDKQFDAANNLAEANPTALTPNQKKLIYQIIFASRIKIHEPTYFEGNIPSFQNLHDCVYGFFDMARCYKELYKENHEVFCKAGKYRSIGDCYSFCLQFFPNCTLSQVVRIINVFAKRNYDVGRSLTGFYCCDINKFVFEVNRYHRVDSVRLKSNLDTKVYQQFNDWCAYFDSLELLA